jgi:hypothetical protein
VEADTVAAEVEAVEPIVAEVPEVEPVVVPSLVLVDEDWVRDAEDPAGPLLRIMELEAAKDDDPAPIRALLGVLEPLMRCYEAELRREPELTLTLAVRRTPPSETEPVGLSIAENVAKPTGMPACVEPILKQALPPHAQDPHGRYAVRFFPHRSEAPPLWLPDVEDVVIEREGGSCFTRRTYPCKPHKHCKAADWERTRCKHPADLPGVAVRWVFAPTSNDGPWPRTGIDLVGTDSGVVWRTNLEPEDAARLGALPMDEGRRHLEDFRSAPLPDALLLAIEPTRVVLADRAGVRVHDRHTGKALFRYVPADPEAPRIFTDQGEMSAFGPKMACLAATHRGAFARLCDDVLLWFDGHAFAVLDRGPPMSLRGETTIDADTSTRSGSPGNPRVALRVAGWRVKVRGRVFLQ